MKPERLASYLPGACLFSFPIAQRSSSSLTNKHRGKERGVQGQRERQRKGGEDKDFTSKTTMLSVNMKTIYVEKMDSSGFKVTLNISV